MVVWRYLAGAGLVAVLVPVSAQAEAAGAVAGPSWSGPELPDGDGVVGAAGGACWEGDGPVGEGRRTLTAWSEPGVAGARGASGARLESDPRTGEYRIEAWHGRWHSGDGPGWAPEAGDGGSAGAGAGAVAGADCRQPAVVPVAPPPVPVPPSVPPVPPVPPPVRPSVPSVPERTPSAPPPAPPREPVPASPAPVRAAPAPGPVAVARPVRAPDPSAPVAVPPAAPVAVAAPAPPAIRAFRVRPYRQAVVRRKNAGDLSTMTLMLVVTTPAVLAAAALRPRGSGRGGRGSA